MHRAAASERLIDSEGIAGCANFFRKIGVAFHESEIQRGFVALEGSAEAERGQHIASERRTSVAIPMNPWAIFDVPNQAVFNRGIRLRRAKKNRGEKAKSVVASGTGSGRCAGAGFVGH